MDNQVLVGYRFNLLIVQHFFITNIQYVNKLYSTTLNVIILKKFHNSDIDKKFSKTVFRPKNIDIPC